MFPETKIIDTNGIRMAVYEQGEGPAVVLLHGFPELAYSWRHQLPALAEAGYRAIAPDQRGYGQTDRPAEVSDYRIEELIADANGMLDTLGLDSAVFAGHDWGALIVWSMALLSPERMDGLIALNIPYFPRPPLDPIAIMRERFGNDFYIVNFQDSDEADRAFGANPGRLFDRLMRKNQTTREAFDQLPPENKVLSLLAIVARQESEGEALLNAEERACFVNAFTESGFTGPINWYRNWSRNWAATEGATELIEVPALFIGGENEVLVTPEHIEAMKPHVPDLEIHMLENCGHWSQQEHPEKVSALMVDWLDRRVRTL